MVSKQHGGEGMMIPFTPLPTLHRAGPSWTIPDRVRLRGRTHVTAPLAPDTWFSGHSHMKTKRKTKERGGRILVVVFFFISRGHFF